MSRYKVLSLPFPTHGFWHDEIIEELNEFNEAMEPVFYRDGWYKDRQTGLTWKEADRLAWKDSRPDDFDFNLGRHDHRPLPKKVARAIGVLMSYNLCPKSLRKLMHNDDDWRMIRGVGRRGRMYRLKAEKCI